MNAKTAFAVLGGVVVGYLARPYLSSGPVSTERMEIQQKAIDLAEDPRLTEYFQLKDLKSKYERADELLGKVWLLLLADVGARMSPTNRSKLEAAARGEHQVVSEPTAVSVVPIRATQEQPLRAESMERPTSPTAASGASDIAVAPSLQPATPSVLRPGSVPITAPVVRGRRGCDHGAQAGWFIAGENPKDYQFGRVEDGGGLAAFIRSLHTKARPESGELDHCVGLPLPLNKKFKVEALIRTLGVRDYANFHIRVENEHREVIAQPKVTLREIPAWKPISLEVDVPPEATIMRYGVLLESQGQIWIKDVRTSVEESGQ